METSAKLCSGGENHNTCGFVFIFKKINEAGGVFPIQAILINLKY